MNEKLRQTIEAVRDALPDFRDLHIYGGLALFAIASFHAVGWYGPAAAGAAVFYLGVWRME